MKKAEFVELLNSNGNNFKMDSENTNNGYPVLEERDTVSITFNDEILYNKILDILLAKVDNYNDDTKTINIRQEEIDTITILDLSNNSTKATEKIQDISGIKNFTNLIKLKLSYNNIRDISELQHLTKLEYLDLGVNNISNIEAISQLRELKTLYLNYNDIEIIPILNWSNLTYLDLRTNKLTNITNLSNLSKLEELYLYNYTYSGVETDKANAIGDISPLEQLQNLTKLDARNQKFIQAGAVGEEINLPLIFIQAKDEQSIAYTENDFILRNCTLNSDGTKLILGKDTTQKASIIINGGSLSGSSFEVNLECSGNIYGDYEYFVNEDEKTIRIVSYNGDNKEITIPSDINEYPVTSIGLEVFKDCSSLISVTIPDTIVYIGKNAFENCSSLTNINVDEKNKQYSSENGVLFNKSKTELICYPTGKIDKNYIIPESAEDIFDYAFFNCDRLENIFISNNVERIGERAFFSCEKLTNIKIPNSVTSIGTFAFASTNFTSVYIPNSVTSIGDFAFNKDNLTIYCNSDSMAEEYAINNNITYVIDDIVPTLTLSGDATVDTIIVNSEATDEISGVDENSYKYKIKKENETYGEVIAGDISHTFTNLKSNTKYIVQVQVSDYLGNTASKEIEVITLKSNKITAIVYYVDEEKLMIKGIQSKTTVEQLKSNLQSDMSYQIIDNSEQIVSNTSNVGTGYKIKLEDGKMYTLVIKGDINGDGSAKLSDLSKLKLSIVGTTQLEGAYREAADLNGDGNVKLSDLSKMKLFLVGKGSL